MLRTACFLDRLHVTIDKFSSVRQAERLCARQKLHPSPGLQHHDRSGMLGRSGGTENHPRPIMPPIKRAKISQAALHRSGGMGGRLKRSYKGPLVSFNFERLGLGADKAA